MTMHRIFNIMILLCTFGFAGDIAVTIKYSNGMPDKTVHTTYSEGMTAMELLKKVAKVKATKTGRYLFVRSIDGVRSQKGKLGWFYTINAKETNKMASSYILNDAHSMTWTLRAEACY